VTSNHPSPRPQRADGALLAGVCATLAQRLGWNAWALRALFVLGLFIQTIATGVIYLLLALLVPRFATASDDPEPLQSADLGRRGERIAELERRFREMERGKGS
jgi:phage shock protein PspC (stress-responsive transcriptional regulator)